MHTLADYDEVGEALGRILLKTKHPKITFLILITTPIIVMVFLKFLLT